MPLLDPSELETSSVVANCHMNRERTLASYARELGANPLSELRSRLSQDPGAAWLDVCCGTGRALIEAAGELDVPTSPHPVIDGLDLVDMFRPNPHPSALAFHVAPLERWSPTRRYAVVTCVHGLHYVGDKLAAIVRMASWLAPDGILLASFDPGGVVFEDGRSAARAVLGWLRESAITYDGRRHVITCAGTRTSSAPFDYLGADDRVGPNYTGQPAVRSFYRRPASPRRDALR